jgi:antitoxin FitA
MSDILVRNLEPRLKRQLEESARKHNRSLSDEAKVLIQSALAAGPSDRKLGTEMYNLIRPEDRGDDLVFEAPGDISKPPDFE